MTVDATMAHASEAPVLLTYTEAVSRDDICPDLLIQEFSRAIAALEDEAERREVAMDWESFRIALSVPTLPSHGPAVVVASVGALT